MMGAFLRFAFLLSLGVSMAAMATADGEDTPAPKMNLDDFTNFFDNFLKTVGQGLEMLKSLVKEIRNMVKKIKNDQDGNKLLEELKKVSEAQSAPLYADPQKSCSTVPEDLTLIENCLKCNNGEWTVHSVDYASCKNAADNAKFNSVFLLLPLSLVAFFR